MFNLIYGEENSDLPLPLPTRGKGLFEVISTRFRNFLNDPLFGQVFSNKNAVVNQTYSFRDTEKNIGKLQYQNMRLSEAIQTVSAYAISLVDYSGWTGTISFDGGLHSDITNTLDSYFFIVDNAGYNIRHGIDVYSML